MSSVQKSHAIDRKAEAPVARDLASKMVLLAGPRQCGKTTLAKALLARLGGAFRGSVGRLVPVGSGGGVRLVPAARFLSNLP